MLKMYSFISKIGQLCLSLIFIEIAIEKFLTEKQRSKDDGQTGWEVKHNSHYQARSEVRVRQDYILQIDHNSTLPETITKEYST